MGDEDGDDDYTYAEEGEEESPMEAYAKKMAGPDKDRPVDNDLIIDIGYVPVEKKDYESYKPFVHEKTKTSEKRVSAPPKKKYEL